MVSTETVWMRLLIVMHYDNGGGFYSTTQDFIDVNEALQQMIDAGFFHDEENWAINLESDYWQFAAGEQTEMQTKFFVCPGAKVVSEKLDEIFENIA